MFYHIMTVLKAEIDLTTSISASPMELAVMILVIMSDVIGFFGNVIMCLTSQ